MDEFNCPICKIQYDRNNRKAYILECGDSACSKCINFYKEAKKELECGKCCNKTKALTVENKSLYKNNVNQNIKPSSNTQKDEFEIYVRKKNTQEKFAILVKKNMTVKELKNKIKAQEKIEPTAYELAFKKPMTDLDQTLESYQIKKPVTITMISEFEGGI